MRTRKEQMTAGAIDGDHNFLGDDSDYRDWYGILGQSRDSSCLERSNFECGLELLGGESDTVRVERFGHWAVGWIEEIYVKPGSPAETIARKIESDLENYPVLNEEDYSEKEQKEANEVWQNCYNNAERVEYMRANAMEFDSIGSIAELMACAKGRWFGGYASELLA